MASELAEVAALRAFTTRVSRVSTRRRKRRCAPVPNRAGLRLGRAILHSHLTSCISTKEPKRACEAGASERSRRKSEERCAVCGTSPSLGEKPDALETKRGQCARGRSQRRSRAVKARWSGARRPGEDSGSAASSCIVAQRVTQMCSASPTSIRLRRVNRPRERGSGAVQRSDVARERARRTLLCFFRFTCYGLLLFSNMPTYPGGDLDGRATRWDWMLVLRRSGGTREEYRVLALCGSESGLEMAKNDGAGGTGARGRRREGSARRQLR